MLTDNAAAAPCLEEAIERHDHAAIAHIADDVISGRSPRLQAQIGRIGG